MKNPESLKTATLRLNYATTPRRQSPVIPILLWVAGWFLLSVGIYVLGVAVFALVEVEDGLPLGVVLTLVGLSIFFAGVCSALGGSLWWRKISPRSARIAAPLPFCLIACAFMGMGIIGLGMGVFALIKVDDGHATSFIAIVLGLASFLIGVMLARLCWNKLRDAFHYVP